MFWYCFFTRSISANYRPTNSRNTKDSRFSRRHPNFRKKKNYGREYISNLRAVLKKFRDAELGLTGDKRKFKYSSISHQGHRIGAEGIHPTQEKINTIRKAPTPYNVSELRSFFTFVNYDHCYLNNISTVLAPLYKLLQKRNSLEMGTWRSVCLWAIKEVTNVNLCFGSLQCWTWTYQDCRCISIWCGCNLIAYDRRKGKIDLFSTGTLSRAGQNYAQTEREEQASFLEFPDSINLWSGVYNHYSSQATAWAF